MVINRYQVLRVPGFGGGLNIADAPEAIQDAEARQLDNVVMPGAGRVTSRKTLGNKQTIVGEVCGIIPYESGNTGMIILAFDAGAVYFYLADQDGKIFGVRQGPLTGWTGLASAPKVTYAVVNERLFLADQKKTAGLTVYQPNYGSTLLQPTFDFDGDGSFVRAKALPFVMAEYNNMILMAGYGTEAETNRPEIVRFSYPGLVGDSEGGGDSGDPLGNGSDGSSWLFARDDYFMVGTRGVPVVAMAAARGRLLIGNPYEMHMLYGFDRTSFALEMLDNERGVVNSYAMTEADGAIYWWSPRGPVRWNGSAVEDLADDIRPLVDRIDPAKVIAAHDQLNRMVYFYYRYRQESGDPDRYLAFDYRRGVWINNLVGGGVTVKCVGFSKLGDSISTEPVYNPPVGAPENLTASNVGDTEAVVSWTVKDAQANTKLYVKKTVDPTYTFVKTFAPGDSSRYSFTGLDPATSYSWYVEHEKNGLTAAATAVSFSTQASGYVKAPVDFGAEAVQWSQKLVEMATPLVRLWWTVSDEDVATEVERSPDGATGWVVIATDAVTLAENRHLKSGYFDANVDWEETHHYRIRHRNDLGDYSTYSAVIPVTVPKEIVDGGGGEGGGGGGGAGGTGDGDDKRQKEWQH